MHIPTLFPPPKESTLPSLFISYAHLDNQPPFGNHRKSDGWVTYFVENLKSNIGRRLGRNTQFDLFMDYKLQGNDEITPELKEQISNVDTLIVFLSPAWLASEWCQWELKTFLEQERDHAGRIFVIELEKINQDKPDVFDDMLGYRFWEETHQSEMQMLGFPLPNPERDQNYFKRILNLSVELAETLKKFQQVNDNPVLVQAKTTVYIAPVGDALVNTRNELISELRQFDIDVLPRVSQQNINDIQKAMDDELEQCSHFIQLLDSNYSYGIPANQYHIAEVSELPILQWLDIEQEHETDNPEQQELLQGKNVHRMLLTDFKRLVREKVLPKPVEEEPAKPNGSKLIFVHTGQVDMNYARQIAERLENEGYGIALPRYTGKPEQIDKSIKRAMRVCHIMLLLQKTTSIDVIEDYLADIITQSNQRESELPVIICSDDRAEDILIKPANTRIFKCKEQFDEHCLEQLLAEAVV